MRTSESAEMYLETILVLSEVQPTVRAIDVAHKTGYSKPSVSRAMSLLRAQNAISVDENGYITLTTAGKEIAEKILERHRILTELLCRIGVNADTAAEDACRIEHVISDTSFARIKAFLKQ